MCRLHRLVTSEAKLAAAGAMGNVLVGRAKDSCGRLATTAGHELPRSCIFPMNRGPLSSALDPATC